MNLIQEAQDLNRKVLQKRQTELISEILVQQEKETRQHEEHMRMLNTRIQKITEAISIIDLGSIGERH